MAALVGAALCSVDGPWPPWLALARGVILGTTRVGAMTTLTYAGDEPANTICRPLATTRLQGGEAMPNGSWPRG